MYWDSFDCEIQSDELASAFQLEEMNYEQTQNQNENGRASRIYCF